MDRLVKARPLAEITSKKDDDTMQKILMLTNQPIIAKGMYCLLETKIENMVFRVIDTWEAVIDELKKTEYQLLISCIEPFDYHAALTMLRHFQLPPLLILSDNVELPDALTLLRSGLLGIVPLRTELNNMVLAIRNALNNQIFISDELKQYLIIDTDKNKKSALPKLSKREYEVAKLMVMGKKNREIGKHLSLHESTISTFKTKIFRKLGVFSLLELKQQKYYSQLFN